jgi:hypothetical protein
MYADHSAELVSRNGGVLFFPYPAQKSVAF